MGEIPVYMPDENIYEIDEKMKDCIQQPQENDEINPSCDVEYSHNDSFLPKPDSMSYLFEKLKGYFKIMLLQTESSETRNENISEAEINEILGIEKGELEILKNIIRDTENFIDIISNPSFTKKFNLK